MKILVAEFGSRGARILIDTRKEDDVRFLVIHPNHETCLYQSFLEYGDVTEVHDMLTVWLEQHLEE